MKSYIPLFLILFSIGLTSQEVDTTMVRLNNELESAITDTTKVKTLLAIGEYQLNRDFSASESYFNEGLSIINGKNEEIYKDLRAALYVQLGVVHRRKANYPLSIEYYLKALKYYEQTKNLSKSGDVYHNMAMVYRYQKEYRKSIRNFQKAIALKKEVRDTSGLGAGYNMLGVSYRINKQLDSALACYQKAKELLTLIDDQDNLYRVNNNIGVLYQFYKEYDKALNIQFENLERCKRLGKKLSMCVTYFNIAGSHIKLKNWDTAIKYADSALIVAKEEDFKERIAKGYQRKSFIYAKMKNFEEAHENYRMFKKYNDTIFNIDNAKKVQALELNYQFQKEKQADSLQFVQEKREVELVAQAESSKKRLYFVLFLGALISGVIIAFLIRRNYQQRSKLAKAMYENERKILDQEIKGKEEDIKRLVADNSMRLAFKEDLLDKIKNDVIGATPEQIKKSLHSLTTQLRLQIETESKLSGLQEKIDAVNKNFDTTLQQSYPELTKGEREVCALLRLNLSIKEIMTIRNVSSDSVKSMRRRIRKKMNIPSEIELEKFIQELV